MNVIESFTVYCRENVCEGDLMSYADDFELEEVRGYPGAFDLIPREVNVDTQDGYRQRLISDPLIEYFDENAEEVIAIEDDFSGGEEGGRNKLFGFSRSRDDGSEGDYLWHHKVMNIEEAWEITRNGVNSKGKGVVVAHPDSGFIDHPELEKSGENRILRDLQRDFVGNDNDAEYVKATHGLATSSVILGNEEGNIKGIAPLASLVPLRVAKVEKGPVPTPVLVFGGPRRLRNAIEHAEDIGADIVSISLGGLKNQALGKAIKRAKDQGIIILAAAGNRVRFVVYPASDENVIAVAASNILGKAWTGSCRGKHVDITAPGENVWKADVSLPDLIMRSSGTSYAVANLAGIAALWLGHWGRDALMDIFGSGSALVEGFRAMVCASASDSHRLPCNGFGEGIVDAKKLLELDPRDFGRQNL